jgi:hypothetical protein
MVVHRPVLPVPKLAAVLLQVQLAYQLSVAFFTAPIEVPALKKVDRVVASNGVTAFSLVQLMNWLASVLV